MSQSQEGPDALIRETIEYLASFERESASEGERRAAAWIAERLESLGCAARVEQGEASGGYWLPLGLASAAAAAAGMLALGAARSTRKARGRRALAVAAGAVAAAAFADDVSCGRHWLRRLALPRRSCWNVVAESGDRGADQTLAILAHHDAAHSGVVFDPRITSALAGRLGTLYERSRSTPPAIGLAFAGPALVPVATLLGRARLLRLGTLLSLASAAAFIDIGRRKVVPGANDNLTAVAVLLAIARELAHRPLTGLRVLLVSTGAEESLLEGMRAFGERHFASLPRERTRFICLDSVGSPELRLLEGEGMLRMYEYDRRLSALLAASAESLGVRLGPSLRMRNGTDGLVPLKAGYATASVISVEPAKKAPSNYHWPTDTPENVDYATVEDTARLCIEAIQRVRDEVAPGG